jgi:hypothetical protein
MLKPVLKIAGLGPSGFCTSIVGGRIAEELAERCPRLVAYTAGG